MFDVYVKTALSASCPTWAQVKAFMQSRNLAFAFVVRGTEEWNVRLSATNRLTKQSA